MKISKLDTASVGMPSLILASLLSVFFFSCEPPKEEAKGGEFISDFSGVSQVESGKAVAVMMTIYKTTLIADGIDKTSFRMAVVDSLGREIKNASDSLRIYLDGNASVTTLDGKTLQVETDTAGLEYMKYQLTDGLAKLIFHAGKEPGKISLLVKSDGLWPSSHEVHTIPSSIISMVPDADQVPKTKKSIGRMIGADISFLPQMEAREVKFYDRGVEKDAITLLRDHGFNYIRLRIFVNPENEKGYSPKLGFCGLDYTLQMAKRVKEAGMKLLLNFHYSDYWADPQQQNKPLSWKDLDFTILKDSVTSYTVKVLNALNAQGTPPAMVQVGNEINHGLLWPEGHISNLDNLAELLQAGVAGVEQVDSEIPIMMHIALGGQNDEAVFWLNNMIARGVEFDIIGLSYYSRWHGTLDDLNYNLHDLIKRYNKPVNVVEYSGFKKEVNDIVFNLPDDMGKGTCIWEPLGRRGGMFDENGEVTDMINIYDSLRKDYLTPIND